MCSGDSQGNAHLPAAYCRVTVREEARVSIVYCHVTVSQVSISLQYCLVTVSNVPRVNQLTATSQSAAATSQSADCL